MLEVKEWIVEDGVEKENASEYIGRILCLPANKVRIIVRYHLCGINQKMITEESTVSAGDFISCTIPDQRPSEDIPFDFPLDILYEDESVLVINKPADLAVIPGPGNWSENVYLALLNYFGKDVYYRIAHRIDKCTSGCLLVTKTKKATRSIGKQMNAKSCYREYVALVHGNLYESGTIDLPLERDPENFRRMGVVKDGKYAFTVYEPVEQFLDASEVKIQLKTGRTHQIRVHLAAIGHPLIGDDLYGTAFEEYDTKGAVLHARILHFIHPVTGEEMKIEAPLPEYYREVRTILKEK